MRFIKAKIPGVYLIELEKREDERGFLARTFCENEFKSIGLNIHWAQCSLTFTKKKGTIRGLHYQAEPKPEIKLVRCVSGAIYDVVLDIRKDSPCYGKWEAFELSSENRLALYIPTGVAHGFQCLVDNCELYYHISEFYHPELARGIRWNDPQVGIPWPVENPFLSERDKNLPLLSEINR
ncbi:MAG: dTDP-4-dehydrorhamnose 3,5-epimerase [Verrucomicrobiia bacterium]